MAGQQVTREQLADLLNEDLSREYQAIIAYVVYSQVLKGAEYMSIAPRNSRSMRIRSFSTH
jgi:bacterioferritin